MAIRDNRIAAESVGIDVTKFKILALPYPQPLRDWPVSYMRITLILLESSKFGYNMSIMILVFAVLGGIGNIRGP